MTRPIRMRTVVVGLLAIGYAVVTLLRVLAGVTVNDSTMAVTALVGAGVLLLLSGIRAALHEHRDHPDDHSGAQPGAQPDVQADAGQDGVTRRAPRSRSARRR